jgi:nucleoside-diphosphate-sugar epimerase
MKVLITGAAGRLGSEACRQFQELGIDFRGADRRTDSNLPFHIEVADIRSRDACYPLVAGCDAVVHLANYPNASAGIAQDVFNENCAMNMNIFQVALEAGVKKIVFASSIQAITGVRRSRDSGAQKPSDLPYLPLDGDVPPNPGNSYAASKVAGEMLLKYFSKFHGITGVAVRYPMLLPHESLARFGDGGDRLSRGQNLDEAFSLLSYPDAARLIIAILRAPLSGFRIYFPAARKPWLNLSIPQIIKQFYEKVLLRKPIEQIHSLIDISQIERETGWTPQDELANT